MEPALSILIVDDHPAMVLTLYDILDDLGYQVTTVRTGQAAIEHCQARKFDVVLLDMRMPDLNGIETYHRIKTMATGTRFILMSATAEDVINENVYSILKKPLDIDNLLSMLEHIRQQLYSSSTEKPGADNE